MKGIELPINALIIIAIAVIVLIAIIAMFYPAFSSGNLVLTSEGAKTATCQILAEAKKCGATLPLTNTSQITISNFDANKDSKNNPGENAVNSGITFPSSCTSAGGADHDNLASLCICYYSITSEANCKKMCGC